MDQGVIRSLKAFYRHSIIKRYITSIDGRRSPTKVNILEAITLLTAAWECISPTTLVNCFRKTSGSSDSQAQSQMMMIRLNCLQHSLKNFKTSVNLQLLSKLMGM